MDHSAFAYFLNQNDECLMNDEIRMTNTEKRRCKRIARNEPRVPVAEYPKPQRVQISLHKLWHRVLPSGLSLRVEDCHRHTASDRNPRLHPQRVEAVYKWLMSWYLHYSDLTEPVQFDWSIGSSLPIIPIAACRKFRNNALRLST